MSIRDLFRALLKLFGLYILISNLFSLPYYLGFFFYDFNWLHLLGGVALGLAMIAFFFFLAFRPDSIINLLRLTNGFEKDEIPVHGIDAPALTRVGVVIVGGFFLLSNIGSILVRLYTLFQSSVTSKYDQPIVATDEHIFDLGVKIVTVIISWILITNSGSIARFLTPPDECENGKQTD